MERTTRTWPWSSSPEVSQAAAVMAQAGELGGNVEGALGGAVGSSAFLGGEAAFMLNGALPLSSGGETAFKQGELDRAMDNVDAKQNGINHFHWNLIREQFGALSRDNNALRQEVLAIANAVMKNEARHAEQIRLIQTVQSEVEREAGMRQRNDETLNANIGNLKQSVQQTVDAHAQRIDETSRAARNTIEALEVEKNERSLWATKVEAQTTSSLRNQEAMLEREKVERVQCWEGAERELRAARAALEKEARDRGVAVEALDTACRTTMAALKQECDDRAVMGSALEERCGSLHNELTSEREQRMASIERVDKRLLEHRELVSVERVAREAQHQTMVEADDSLRNKLQVDIGRLENLQQIASREYREQLAEHKNAFDIRMQAERASRDEQHAGTMQAMQDRVVELRRETSAVEEHWNAGELRLRELLADQKEATDRTLRGEVAKITGEIQSEHTRMRECDRNRAEQVEQLDKRMQNTVHDLGDQLQQLGEALSRSIAKNSDNIEKTDAKLRAADSALKDHFDRIEREIRHELGQEKADRQDGDSRLKAGQEENRSSIEALQQKLKDDVTALTHSHRTFEQELRAELGRTADALQAGVTRLQDNTSAEDNALRAEIDRASKDLDKCIKDLRDHVDRRYAVIDEQALNEKKLREAGDNSLFEKLEAYGKQEKDDAAAQAEDRQAIRYELQNSVLHMSQRLEGEKVSRLEQDHAFNDRVNALQEALSREWALKLSRSEYDTEAKRVWEAIDSHTHQVQPPPPPQVIVEEKIVERLVQQPMMTVQQPRVVQAPTTTIVQGGPRAMRSTGSVSLPQNVQRTIPTGSIAIA